MKKSGLLLIVVLLGTAGVVHAVDYTKSDAATADWNDAAWSPAPGTWTDADKALITGGAVNWTDASHADSTLLNRVEVKASPAGTTLNISSYLKTWTGLVMNWNNTGTATINHSAAEYRLVGNSVYDSTIGYRGANNTAIYNLSGTGALKIPGHLHIGRESTGTLNMSGGILDVWGTDKSLYIGSAANGVGTINLSGGVLTPSGSGKVYVGDSGSGTINQTGGKLALKTNMILNNNATGSGTYTISGGEIDTTIGRWALLKDGALFEVDGSGASSIELSRLDAAVGSVFRINLDAGGSTLVKASRADAGSGVDIYGTLELDTIAGFDGVYGDTYDLFWAQTGNMDTNSMTFANLSGSTDFDLSIVNGVDGGDVLRATVIPEPATLGLIGIVSVSMIWIRRLFMI